jgi:hypothetical protein
MDFEGNSPCSLQVYTNTFSAGLRRNGFRADEASLLDYLIATPATVFGNGSPSAEAFLEELRSIQKDPNITVSRSAPERAEPPGASGTPQVGATLTVTPATWHSVQPLTARSYAWSHCSSAGSCAPISGPGSSTYTVQPTDAGSTIHVTETASNPYGQTTSAETSTAPIARAGNQPSSDAPAPASSRPLNAQAAAPGPRALRPVGLRVSGLVKVGGTLRCRAESGGSIRALRWLRDGHPVRPYDRTLFHVRRKDASHRIACEGRTAGTLAKSRPVTIGRVSHRP